LKKYCSTTVDSDQLEREAFEKFLAINDHMGHASLDLRNSIPWDHSGTITDDTPRMEAIHLRARALVHKVLGEFDITRWFEKCKNSSGTTIGVSYNNTSVEKKFSYPISVTMRAKPYFDAYLAWDKSLAQEVAVMNGDRPTGPYKIVAGSRATTVTKNSTVRRFISVEPTANMYLQQGLMEEMYDAMKKCGLDVSVLPDNHVMRAMIASITGDEATIDWSSASDCQSCTLLRWNLPSGWYSACMATRSPTSEVNNTPHFLNLYATMGNATTFPLETIIFWAYAHAVHMSRTCGNSRFPNWDYNLDCCSVFGDDCIVPTESADEFMSVMTSFGFMVNREKSFFDRDCRFRESCGGDFLAGYDVRPVFLGEPHSTAFSALEPWLYTILNRLIPKYIKLFGPLKYVYDKALFRTIVSIFVENGLSFKLVPRGLPEDSGTDLSDDLSRFCLEYRPPLSPISRDMHGTYYYKLCSFRYRSFAARCDGVRYQTWLKKPGLTTFSITKVKKTPRKGKKAVVVANKEVDRDPLSRYKTRRVGGYVVASGLTSHWFVPYLG
jgi:hypothetical protein